MKPILLSTNYSPASQNAGDYAAQLAKLCHVPLVVLHTWTMPVLTPEDAVAVPPVQEFHEREREQLEKELARLKSKWNVEVSGIEANGFTADELEDLYNQHKFSLVVMGTHHYSVLDKITGSTAMSLLHHAGYPILLVPDSISFTKPSTILLAADTVTMVDDPALNALKLVVRATGTKLEIVNVESPDEIFTVSETPATIKLETSLRYINHDWKVEVNENVTEGIHQAAETTHADWIAVAPRHFSWIEEIFKRGVTRRLAYSTDRPLLVLPAAGKKTD